METRARSFAKALSWQAVGFAAMMLIGYLFTGSLATGGRIACVSMASSFVVYLCHERIWALIGWGRE